MTQCGWLTVNSTRINYPVVKYKDNDYYLTHSFDKTYNSAGWIFANYANKFDVCTIVELYRIFDVDIRKINLLIFILKIFRIIFSK